MQYNFSTVHGPPQRFVTVIQFDRRSCVDFYKSFLPLPQKVVRPSLYFAPEAEGMLGILTSSHPS